MSTFHFKQFSITDDHCGMKVCTDSVLLGAWTAVAIAEAAIAEPTTIIDLGAGSGLLSLMCAQHWPAAKITAVEIDADACADAERNFKESKWADTLTVANADAMTFQPTETVDLVICNPPYFTSTLLSPTGNRAVARHGKSEENADQTALTPHTAIAIAAKWLSQDGTLAMVTPADNVSELIFQAELNRLAKRSLCLVKQTATKEPSRVLWLFSKTPGRVTRGIIDIRGKDNTYTHAYKTLTAEFYL